MKKSLLALAALTAFAGVASAQSSVTLFGIIDQSVNIVKNGAISQKLLSSNQLNSNRLGFRGVEDLGGGLRAGFWIEGAMNNDDGTGSAAGGGQNWQRRSTVSLMGGFGEIRLGRDYTPTFLNKTVFDPFGTNGLGSDLNLATALGSGATTLVRASNSVGYFLPAMGGLYGQVMVALGEGVTGNKYAGFRGGYAAGPLNIAAAYGKTYKNDNAPSNAPMYSDFKDINFGASYNLGFMTLMGQYGKVQYDPGTVANDERDQKKLLLGVTVPFGASTLKASYIRTNGAQGSSATGFDARQFAFGYQYDLSKRTAIYATASSLNNAGTAASGARFTVGQGVAMVRGGDTSRGYNLGVRHSF